MSCNTCETLVLMHFVEFYKYVDDEVTMQIDWVVLVI